MSQLRHVAIIMDGNGRWAERRGHPRIYGHIRGCSRARDVIREATTLGVGALTLFAFSSENWGRPEGEINILMRLLRKWLDRRTGELMENNIRFRAMGAIENLPREVIRAVRATEEVSKNNTGMKLTFALSYGAREEIIQVAQRLAARAANGLLKPEAIDETLISNELLSKEIGDPDLLIRTSGEQRISNFMLWQLAYAELYFTETMWPDFGKEDFRLALQNYFRRERRYGLTSHQIEARAL